MPRNRYVIDKICRRQRRSQRCGGRGWDHTDTAASRGRTI